MFKKDVGVYNRIIHVKGGIVLLAALFIALVLLAGENGAGIPLLCSCIVTFYFGSKS